MGNARKYRWTIETSHMVAVPKEYEVYSLDDLRQQIQSTADSKRHEPGMGEINYRYELNSEEDVTVVHAYFVNRFGKQSRFMRLRYEGEL